MPMSMSMSILRGWACVFAGIVLCGGPAHAASSVQAREQGQEGSVCRARERPELAVLDRVHRVEEFRIFYTLHGPDALLRPQDRDGNGVPDVVEDAARQFTAARRVYTEAIGLVHPLAQPRYRASARSIDVHMRRLGTRSTGLAYDEIGNQRRAIDGPSGQCALRIDLDTRWQPPSQTPAHELFHLFQNGYTMLKVRWFTEGAARWAETVLGAAPGRPGALPVTVDLREALFASSYRASGFWHALTRLQDPVGRLQMPAALRTWRYADDRPVLADDRLHGGAFMKAVLEAMGRADRRVSRRHGWPPFGWKESAQKSRAHDGDAWTAVMEAVRQFGLDTPEVERMLALPASVPVPVAAPSPEAAAPGVR